MKIKFKSGIICSLATIMVIFSVILYIKSPIKTYADQDLKKKEYAVNSAKNFIDSISLIEKGKNLNTNFEKIASSYDQKKKIDKWKMENDEVIVETDGQANPITYINKLKTSQGNIKDVNKKIDKDELRSKAKDISDKFSKESKIFDSEEDMFNAYRTYKWKRTYNGFKYDYDFVLVTLDPSTGETAAASKRFISNTPKNSIKLNEEQAKEIAKSTFEKNQDFKIGNIENIETLIVNPNYRWTDKATVEFIADTRLAYAINLKMINPYEGNLVIWIDAEDGSVLGGTITK